MSFPLGLITWQFSMFSIFNHQCYAAVAIFFCFCFLFFFSAFIFFFFFRLYSIIITYIFFCFLSVFIFSHYFFYQVKVCNIHVRYEDRYTNPKRPFSIGLTLQELLFQTTDENWKPCVIKEAVTQIYKVSYCIFGFLSLSLPRAH